MMVKSSLAWSQSRRCFFYISAFALWTFTRSSPLKLPSPKQDQLFLWSLSEPAQSACSELSYFRFWWHQPSERTQKKNLTYSKSKNYCIRISTSPHLIRMWVYHLLADAVQLCRVGNKAEVLLLDDLQSRLTRWPPQLLEHLRQTEWELQWEPECKQAELEWQTEGDNCAARVTRWPAWQPKRRYGLFLGVPAAQPGQKER